MKIVDVRGLRIGEGIPKICVPMTGTTVEELKGEAAGLCEAGADLAEWRMDWFSEWKKEEILGQALEEIRRSLGEIPLLVTFRTEKEGGNAFIDPDGYRKLYGLVLQSGCADMIDLELFFERTVVTELLKTAKGLGVKTVLSSHDFQKTPEDSELRSRLFVMEALGADVAKIAVMPRSPQDVARLLLVTAEGSQKLSCPVITMSMGGRGVISRLAGESFGSAVTFGTVGRASAPGQISLKPMKEVLTIIHSAQ